VDLDHPDQLQFLLPSSKGLGTLCFSKRNVSRQNLPKQNRRITHHYSRPNDVLTLRIDQSRRQKVEIVCDPICDYSMSSIVSSLGPGTKLHSRAEDIDELAFSLVIEVSIIQRSNSCI
jgi:hypothetical protein